MSASWRVSWLDWLECLLCGHEYPASAASPDLRKFYNYFCLRCGKRMTNKERI